MTLPRRGGRYLTTLRRPDAAAVNARDLALVFMKMQSIALEQQARIDGEALRAARQIRAASLGRTGYARSLISTTQVLRRERATSLRAATSPAAAAAAAAEMAKARSSGQASSKQRKSSKRKLSSSDGGASDDRLTSDLKRRPTGRLPKTVTDTLVGWFLSNLHHPFPTSSEKKELATLTNLSPRQLKNYFTNLRKRHWTPILKGQAPRGHLDYAVLSALRGGSDARAANVEAAAAAATAAQPVAFTKVADFNAFFARRPMRRTSSAGAAGAVAPHPKARRAIMVEPPAPPATAPAAAAAAAAPSGVTTIAATVSGSRRASATACRITSLVPVKAVRVATGEQSSSNASAKQQS